MGVVQGIFTFLIIWWLVIFMVLPWGVKVARTPEEGHAASAPVAPKLWRKALITTLITALLWGIVFVIVEFDLVTFRAPAD